MHMLNTFTSLHTVFFFNFISCIRQLTAPTFTYISTAPTYLGTETLCMLLSRFLNLVHILFYEVLLEFFILTCPIKIFGLNFTTTTKKAEKNELLYILEVKAKCFW